MFNARNIVKLIRAATRENILVRYRKSFDGYINKRRRRGEPLIQQREVRQFKECLNAI